MRNLPLWSPTLGDVLLTKTLLEEILGGDSGGLIITSMADTVGAVISAAAINGGIVARTGPTAPFTDTTDTAAAIVAAVQQGGAFQSGDTFEIVIKNITQYVQTIAGGDSVSMSSVTTLAPFVVTTYLATIGGTADAPTVTLAHVSTVPLRLQPATVNPSVTTVSNAAAQTLAAAAIAAGVIARDTQSAARTDTTDTAVAIIAAASGLGVVGTSFKFRYNNNGAFPITLAGGVGVTLAQVVPANSWVEFLITQNASATVVAVVIGQGYYPKLGVTGAANGATPVTVADTKVTANSIITLTINTVGGTAHGGFVSSKTASVGFSFNSLAGDTSTYDYKIEG